jgi:undecaprenyl-diphosphatase
MTVWQALILGIVEGITEFLPVSSTGHLLVAQAMLAIPDTEASRAYAVCIQAGAILAVLAAYPKRIQAIVSGLLGQSEHGRRLLVHLMVAFAPAAVLGLLFDDAIDAYLFGPWPVVAAWAAGGVVLLAFARRGSSSGGAQGGMDIEALTARQALWIGLFQVVALWPGTSRSLMTILGGLYVGLGMLGAVEFSFLLGLVTLTAATAFKLLSSGDVLWATYSASSLGVGVLAAAVSAFASVRWMIGWLERRGLAVFGWWRLLAAALTAAWVSSGGV